MNKKIVKVLNCCNSEVNENLMYQMRYDLVTHQKAEGESKIMERIKPQPLCHLQLLGTQLAPKGIIALLCTTSGTTIENLAKRGHHILLSVGIF